MCFLLEIEIGTWINAQHALTILQFPSYPGYRDNEDYDLSSEGLLRSINYCNFNEMEFSDFIVKITNYYFLINL